MKNKKLVLVSIFTFLVSNTAAAEIKTVYVGTSYGIGIANKIGSQYKLTHDSSFPRERPKDSQVFSLVLGHRLNNSVRVELAFNHFHNFKYQGLYDYVDYTLKSEGENKEYEYKQKVRSNTLFANIYYDFNQFNKFTSYVNMGLGLSKNKSGALYLKHKKIVGDSWEIANKSEVRNQFAWNIGIGISYELNNKVNLDLINYRYNNLGKFSTKEDRSKDRMIIKNLKIHSISTGIRIQF